MILFKVIINKIKKCFIKQKSRDISNCFAPLTVVYKSGYEAYRKGWKE